MIEIDRRIRETSLDIGEAGGCQVRLVRDQRYFWVLVLPLVEGVTEWHDLPEDIHGQSSRLVRHLAAGIKQASGATRMNVAAIGNVVPMLHIHIVARSPGDQHWPQPIWGQGKPEPLTKAEETWRVAVVRDLITGFIAARP